MTKRSTLILASASPRRLALLQQLGFNPRIVIGDIDERALEAELPEACIQRLAKEKAQHVLQNLPDDVSGAVVVGADTFGLLNGQLLLKPDSFEDAVAMWTAMSGQWHEVMTAVAVLSAHSEQVVLQKSQVLFAEINHQQMQAYWQSGEPQDKAGAYAIQGLAAAWVKEIRGSYSSIMGLPLYETAQLLKPFNFQDVSCLIT